MNRPDDFSLRSLRLASLFVVAVTGSGVFLSALLRTLGLGKAPVGGGIFFRLFALYETIPLLLVLLTALVLLFTKQPTERTERGERALPTWTIWSAVVAVLGVAIAGAAFTGLNTALSMDEFNVGFQARIFAKRTAIAGIPREWREFVPAMKPVFVAWLDDRVSWASAYLPATSIVRALFDAVNLGWLMNPLVAALTILVLAGVCEEETLPGVDSKWAVVLLAASPQFLLTAMTGYSMPLHALASVVWLRWHLKRHARTDAFAAVTGAFALGLHNPFPHALFVAPFLIRLVLQAQWKRLLIYAPVYLVACVGWWAWFQYVRTVSPGSSGLSSFALPSLEIIALQLLNLNLIFSWQVTAAAVLVVSALFQWRSFPAPLLDLAIGLVGTFAFYFLFPHDQGHGWGYRYVYACLPAFAILGAWGLKRWRTCSGRWAERLVTASLAVTLLVQLPYRLWEARSVATPFSKTHAAVRAVVSDIVILPTSTRWYAIDLIRNDPWLKQGPVVMARERLEESQLRFLRARFPGRVQEWTDDDLARFGLEPVSIKPTR